MRTRAAERGLHLRLLCREIALPAPPSVAPSHAGIRCQSGCRVWRRSGPGRVGGKDHRTRVRVPCGASSDRRAHPDPGNRTDRHAPRGPIGTPHRASCCRNPHTDKPRTEKPHTLRSIDSSTACQGLGPAAASAACPGQDSAPVHPCASSRAAWPSIVELSGAPISLPITCRTPFPQTNAPNNHEEAHDELAGSTLAGSTVIGPALGRPPRRRGAVKAPAVKADRQDAERSAWSVAITPHKTVLGAKNL